MLFFMQEGDVANSLQRDHCFNASNFVPYNGYHRCSHLSHNAGFDRNVPIISHGIGESLLTSVFTFCH